MVDPLLRTLEQQPLVTLPKNPDCPIRVVWAERDRIMLEHVGITEAGLFQALKAAAA